RRRLLEIALAYYQEFIEQRQDDPGAQKDLASTRDRVRQIIADLAVLQGAGQFILLRDFSVLEDLGVSADQRQRLDEQREISFGEFHRLPAGERSRQFLEMVRKSEAAIAAIL